MNSPLLRVLAIVLGWPLVLLAPLAAYEWYLDEYYVPSFPPPSTERVQHPNYHRLADQALARLAGLPATERRVLLAELTAALMPASAWLDALDRAGFDLLCIGEDHDPLTRRFLAATVFRSLRLDILHLEATPDELADVERRMAAGRGYAPLLGADIGAVLTAARRAEPALTVTAIEETDRQRSRYRRPGGRSRDDSLLANFEAAYVEGRRNALLFGALHCTNDAGWLFGMLHRRLPLAAADRAINVRVLGEHQDGPLEAFVYFLDQAGLRPGSFALPDTNRVPPAVRSWFRLLWHQTLGKYGAALVFRDGAGG